MGFTPVLAPMLKIELLTPSDLPDFSAAQAVLVTSSNGMDALSRLTTDRTCPVITVGDRTAEAGRLAGFTDLRSALGDGQALLEMAEQTLTPKDGTVVHIRGRDAAVTFEPLAEAGFTLTEVIGYEAVTKPTLPPEAISPPPAAALIYSARTAAAFASALANTTLDPSQLTCIGISETALAPLIDTGARLEAAKAPTEAAIFGALSRAFPEVLKN